MASHGLDEDSVNFLDKPAISFDDVCGLEDVKQVLKEYILLPLKFPKLFSGGVNNKLSRTALVFGAPGVGKSYLAKSLGSQFTLFRCYFTDFTRSRWHGVADPHDVVSELFDNAIQHQPSYIVIEECESCDISRSSDMKCAAFIKRQISILQERGHNVHVVFVTNTPGTFPDLLLDICDIFINVPMPDFSARVQMFRSFIDNSNGFTCSGITEEDHNYMASKTDGFTGADINCLCRDAMMEPLRKIQRAQYFKKVSTQDGSKKWRVCEEGEEGAVYKESFMEIPGEEFADPEMCRADLETALRKARPSICTEDLQQYQDFIEMHLDSGKLKPDPRKRCLSLQELCKICIQRCVTWNRMDCVTQLPLPQKLKSFVLNKTQ